MLGHACSEDLSVSHVVLSAPAPTAAPLPRVITIEALLAAFGDAASERTWDEYNALALQSERTRLRVLPGGLRRCVPCDLLARPCVGCVRGDVRIGRCVLGEPRVPLTANIEWGVVLCVIGAHIFMAVRRSLDRASDGPQREVWRCDRCGADLLQ